jgi:ABC-2 type transport system ATP-binding protein
VGYLPEHNPLYDDMYVRESLRFVAGLHRLDDRQGRVERVLNEVGLLPEVHKKVGQLSKGYRQRVGLAQALIHDPEVLILDEPTSGLDPNQLVDIRALIRRLGQDRLVVLSTHVMQEVEAMCDRVVLIRKGEIVADAPLAELASAEGGLEGQFKSLTR